jgi:four helix bundle protein
MNEPGEELCDLRERTKRFALCVIRVYAALPKRGAGEIIGRQLVRSGTSVGAQYREATRARSRAEFISKVEGALQELEETNYWFELVVEAWLVPGKRLAELRQEAHELTAILIASVKTAKKGR